MKSALNVIVVDDEEVGISRLTDAACFRLFTSVRNSCLSRGPI